MKILILLGIFIQVFSVTSCSSHSMRVEHLDDVFEKCGQQERIVLKKDGTCIRRLINGKKVYCQLEQFDDVTAQILRDKGYVIQTRLLAGINIPVADEDGEEYSIPIDGNTNIIFNKGMDTEVQTYLAGSTWKVANVIVGQRSRILNILRYMSLDAIKSIEIYSEMTFKRGASESCLNRIN